MKQIPLKKVMKKNQKCFAASEQTPFDVTPPICNNHLLSKTAVTFEPIKHSYLLLNCKGPNLVQHLFGRDGA